MRSNDKSIIHVSLPQFGVKVHCCECHILKIFHKEVGNYLYMLYSIKSTRLLMGLLKLLRMLCLLYAVNMTSIPLMGFGSDCATVMIGETSGISTRLKELMGSVHCAAHRLSLATSQSADAILQLKRMKSIVNGIFTNLIYHV